MSPYQYAYNNPLQYVDPSGNMAMMALQYIHTAQDLYSMVSQYADRNCTTVKQLAVNALAGAAAITVGVAVGAVVGALGVALFPGSLLAAVAFGAAGGIMAGQYSRLVSNLILCKEDPTEGLLNPSDMLIEGVLGGLGGAVGYGLEKFVESLLVAKAMKAAAGSADDGVRTLYHATNEQSAKSIADHGIDLTKTKLYKDLNPSGKRGFYLTENLEQAQAWALQKFPNSPAIVQFDVPVNQLDELSGKVFTSGDADWLKFVNEGRGNILQHTFDYVEGPYLKLGIREPLGHQMAIFTDEAVNLFDECVKRIFW